MREREKREGEREREREREIGNDPIKIRAIAFLFSFFLGAVQNEY